MVKRIAKYAERFFLSLLLFSFLKAVPGDSLAIISDIMIDEKQNGILVYTRTTKTVDKTMISGWITDANWIYFTIYHAQSDTTALNRTIKNGPIREIEATNTKESTQIAIRIAKSVETIDFYTDTNPPGIYFTLGYPDEIFAMAGNSSKKENSINKDQIDRQPVYMPWYSPLKKSLYLFGTIMSVSGIISADNSDEQGNELTIGLTVLTGTIVFDKFIFPRIKKTYQ